MFAVKKRGEEEGPKVENWLTVSKVTRLQKKKKESRDRENKTYSAFCGDNKFEQKVLC